MNPFFEPGAEQKKAIHSITTFLKTGNESVFILKGYAGTGKSLVLGRIAELSVQLNRQCILMAPTGRAARILSEKTGMPCSTIHRAIYTFDNEELSDKDNLEVRFTLAENMQAENTVYIIDEASMISDVCADGETLKFGSGRLLFDIIDFVQPANTNRKIIFCGDPAQLPPVNMNDSPALHASYLQTKWNLTSRSCTLTEVFRQQQDNSLLEASIALRNELSKPVVEHVSITPDGKQMKYLLVKELYEWYAGIIRQKKIPPATWICYSNKAAHSVNTDIRSYLGFLRSEIEENELLMVTQNNYSNEVLFLNGDLVRVHEVSSRIERKEVVFNYRDKKNIRVELIFRDAAISLLHQPEQRHTIKLLVNTLDANDRDLLHVALFVLVKNRYQQGNKATKFDRFKRDDSYYNALHIRYGYAMTCHKAQGGEWETIIADFDHPSGKGKKSYLRWAYTAITRASQQLFILNPVELNALSGIVVHQIEFLRRKRSVPLIDNIEVFDDDPEVFQLFPFIKQLVNRISSVAKDAGITVDFEYLPYRLRIHLQLNSRSASADVLYSKKGFKQDLTIHKNSDEQLIRMLSATMNDSLNKRHIPAPPEPFRAMMHQKMMHLCQQFDIQCTGLIEAAYVDTYLLKTDQDGAEIDCYYNADKRYTTLIPKSILGGADKKMVQLTTALSNKGNIA